MNTRNDDPGPRLVCPTCGFDYHHFSKVTIWDRKKEDAPTQIISIWGPADETPNPSSRRRAITIHFSGECGHDWRMELVEHKGWVFVDETLVRA